MLQQLRVPKSLDKRRAGVSRFSVKFFLSHSVENFHRGILYCCINFRWRKSLWTRGGKEVSRFSIEKIFSHTAENLRRESFAVGLISGTQKVRIRWVSFKTFRQKCFLSHSAEVFPREYFIVAIISRTEKVWRRGGGGEYQDFPSKTFVSHCRKSP